MSVSQELDGIAIIGIACRLPGANDPTTFWTNLCQGVESITFFSDEELLAAGVESSVLHNPNYIKAAPILQDVDKFDAAFFEYSPKEAAVMDPQHRLFLEVCWEAFEDAGYHPPSYEGAVGVYAGVGGVITSYLMAYRDHPALSGETAGVQHIGNDKDFLSTRVSYKLNLTGPSMTIQTACSTSFVAVHLACQSLLHGESDMALAGASTVRVPHRRGYWVEKGNIYSMDGHCRAFDANGQGTIFGSGVAAVLLKNLRDAVADGDHIYAVIKATAVNNDGGMKVSYTAPSATGQSRAMIDAFTLANISPETVGYVECHATGTIVGDPLEIQALTRTFRTQTDRNQFCAVGSVKTNIGHPEQTAGVAGLIKTALILKHRRIPPSLHFDTPNPNIDFEHSPFYVNTTLSDWPATGTPHRAAVNSLGIGGTNAFAVLEEAPEVLLGPVDNERPLHLFCLSAKTEPELQVRAKQFRTFLEDSPNLGLANVCYTANLSRSHFAYRLAMMTDTLTNLQEQLAAFVEGSSGQELSSSRVQAKPVVFLFTGQGSQYPGMAAELYRTQPTFRAVVDECEALLGPFLDRRLLDVLFASGDDSALLHETAYTQPALFTVEYALAQLWQAWGVRPSAVMGHSIGELVAACVAGVFELHDALRLVAERGRIMQGLPKQGAMAVVFAAETVVQEVLISYADRVSIAAVNSPQNTVISGDREVVPRILETLKAANIASTPLTVSHAFHSPLMEPILDTFEELADHIAYREPRIPLISNLTGKPLAGAPDSRYWREHVRHTVRFADGMHSLHELGYELFIEVGPGQALLGMGRQCLSKATGTWLPSLSKPKRDWQTMLESLRKLYLAGFSIDWQMVEQGYARRRVPLPTYPFQRKRHWLDETQLQKNRARRHLTPGDHPLLGTRLHSSLREIQFESVYSVEQLPYFADHQIYGRVVLPTTAGLEAVIAAGHASFASGGVQIERLVYHEALVLPEDEARLVQVILTPQDANRAAFKLLSTVMDGHEDWHMHMSGMLHLAPNPNAATKQANAVFSVQEIRSRCPQGMPVESFYRAVSTLGLSYGSTFKGVQQLWRGAGEVVSHVRLPTPVASAPYALHPAFLDACLHTYLALTRDYGDPSLAYLPLSLERFRLYRDHITEAWSHVVLRGPVNAQGTLTLDICLYDMAGHIVAAFDGLAVGQLPPKALSSSATPAFAEWLYQIRWEERSPSVLPDVGVATPPASWLIFADQGGLGTALAALLRQRGDRCHFITRDTTFARDVSDRWRVDPAQPEDFHRLVREISASEQIPCRGAIYLWALDVPSMHDMTLEQLEMAETMECRGALFLTQALTEARIVDTFTPRLWVVTRNAQNPNDPASPAEAIQAPLWGFGRTVQLEYPHLWGGLIDLPPEPSPTKSRDAEALLAELLRTDGEDQVALRDGQRFVARFVRLPENHTPQTNGKLRHDATYLVTGGLGMLGLKIAHWLVEQKGVRYLVLTSRRGAQGTTREAVKALERLGAQVHVIQADVSRQADVQRLMDEIRHHLPPLRGVFHGAGVLDDGILSQMSWAQFTRATSPKIKGSWLLHQHTQSMELDVFVLLSSVLSMIGSAGQANYTAGNAFMDALAAYRRALGFPAMAVNFGPWDESGMATASGSRGEAIWRARGMAYIPPESGMRVFDHLIRLNLDHAAVTMTDWAVYLRQLPVSPPVYTEMTSEVGPEKMQKNVGEAQTLQTHLWQAPQQDQRTVLADFISQRIMEELGFEDTIDAQQPLHELGLDSLMSVNVVNRLESSLGIPIAAAKLIKGPSLDEFVDDLLRELPETPGTVSSFTSPVQASRVPLPETTAPAAMPPAAETSPPPGMAPTLERGAANEAEPVREKTTDHEHLSPIRTEGPQEAVRAANGSSVRTPAPSRKPLRTSKTAGDGWLVFHRPNDSARIRLFYFPFAGGGAAACRTWDEDLYPSIEIVGVEPPGRASRIHEPPLDSMADFLDALVPAMVPYLDRPFAFFGHCLGGLTLFETARVLREEYQLHVEHIFVSGARPPHRGTHIGRFEEMLLADLLKHDQFDPFLPPYEQPDEVFMELLRHFRLDATEEFLQIPELRQLLLPTIRAEFAMATNYRCPVKSPWETPITCFIGLDDSYVSHEDAMAWSRFTKSSFKIHMREGTHFLVVDDREFILDTINRELGP